jgi:hypothetical protein
MAIWPRCRPVRGSAAAAANWGCRNLTGSLLAMLMHDLLVIISPVVRRSTVMRTLPKERCRWEPPSRTEVHRHLQACMKISETIDIKDCHKRLADQFCQATAPAGRQHKTSRLHEPPFPHSCQSFLGTVSVNMLSCTNLAQCARPVHTACRHPQLRGLAASRPNKRIVCGASNEGDGAPQQEQQPQAVPPPPVPPTRQSRIAGRLPSDAVCATGRLPSDAVCATIP